MQPGDQITPFRAPASTGHTLEWDAYAGKVPVVLAFLPGVHEAADLDELAEFDRMHAEFGEERVQVLGVVKATASHVRDTAERNGFSVPVLADAAGTIIASFGMDEPDGSAKRATVIIDRSGTVAKTFDHAPPSGHAAAVLAAVRELKDSDDYEMTPTR